MTNTKITLARFYKSNLVRMTILQHWNIIQFSLFANHAQDLQTHCERFKKVSDPVKACLRKADPAAKAKAKAKKVAKQSAK